MPRERDPKALANVLKMFEKEYGKGVIQVLGNKQVEPTSSLSTGSIGLDLALGVGGVPEGRIIEVYGPESSGKTTLTLHLIAECQRSGGVVAFVDAEHALDLVYAKNLGVDVEKLLVSQPDFGEQALDIVDGLVSSNSVDLIIIDSVAALTPKSEIDGDMETQSMGVQARMMSKILRKITALTSKNGVTVVFINQIRMKIGTMGYGSPETTTGGNALKFYSSVRIDIRKIATLKQGDVIIGNRVKAKIIKNKVAAPFKQAEFDIDFGKGISKVGEIVDYGVKLDIIDKSGAWFSYGEIRVGQGREKSKDFLRANPTIMNEIETKIKEKLASDSSIISFQGDNQTDDSAIDE